MQPNRVVPRWEPVNRRMPCLGLVASNVVRDQGVPPGFTIGRLIEDHRRAFERSFIFSTWGTYRDSILDPSVRGALDNNLDGFQAYNEYKARFTVAGRRRLWEPRWRWLRHGHCLRPGKYGGIIEMAERLEESAGQDRIRTLVFLMDPDDLEKSYPEDRALIRSAIRNNAVLLTTYRCRSA